MADKKTTAADIHKLIKEKEVKYVDIRFTDPRGKWQHVTFDLMMVDDDFLNEGTMFDGSSIAGWKAINESDMLLKPDLDTAVIDPFFAQTTLILICDVLEPTSWAGLLKFLYPGMHMKRWVLLIMLGLVMCSLGIAYLLVQVYREQPLPEFAAPLTLQFIDRPIRGDYTNR